MATPVFRTQGGTSTSFGIYFRLRAWKVNAGIGDTPTGWKAEQIAKGVKKAALFYVDQSVTMYIVSFYV